MKGTAMKSVSYFAKIVWRTGLISLILAGCGSMPHSGASSAGGMSTDGMSGNVGSGEAAFDVSRDVRQGGGN
jgi:hypothetical protein